MELQSKFLELIKLIKSVEDYDLKEKLVDAYYEIVEQLDYTYNMPSDYQGINEFLEDNDIFKCDL